MNAALIRASCRSGGAKKRSQRPPCARCGAESRPGSVVSWQRRLCRYCSSLDVKASQPYLSR